MTMGLFLPQQGIRLTFEFFSASYPSPGVADNFQPYYVPANASFLWVFVQGPGSGGAGGQSGASGTSRGGGGSGGAGSFSSYIIPAFLLPRVLYVRPGKGGDGGAAGLAGQAGGTSLVRSQPEISTNGATGISSQAPGAGGAPSGGTGGTGGNATTGSLTGPIFQRSVYVLPASPGGLAGGTGAAAGTSVNGVHGGVGAGAGGGGCGTDDVARAGGSQNTNTTQTIISRAQSSTAGADGLDAIVFGSPENWAHIGDSYGPFYYAPATGGTSHGTGQGGKGGDGILGCGGAGGGAGVTGGAGGRGGDGFVMIGWW